MSNAPAYQIRAYQDGDEHRILEAFNRIFARADPNFRPRSLEEWRWQYERNPSGRRIVIAVSEDGRVLAQYAGIPQRVLLDGQPGHFSQPVDSLSDPECKRLTREPLFVQTGRPFAAGYGGDTPEKDTIMWGLPVPVAFRIGKHGLKYELLRQQHKLGNALGRLALPASPLEAEELRAFPADVDALAARAARERRAIAVRDQAHMCWRYTDNPYHSYRQAAVRRAGELVGLAVYRKGSFDQVEDGLVVDWLAPAGDEDVRAALLAWVIDCARAEGCERLTAVFPDTAPEWLDFQRLGFRVHATRYFLVGRSYAARHPIPWIRRHWYYTLGDTDLA